MKKKNNRIISIFILIIAIITIIVGILIGNKSKESVDKKINDRNINVSKEAAYSIVKSNYEYEETIIKESNLKRENCYVFDKFYDVTNEKVATIYFNYKTLNMTIEAVKSENSSHTDMHDNK